MDTQKIADALTLAFEGVDDEAWEEALAQVEPFLKKLFGWPLCSAAAYYCHWYPLLDVKELGLTRHTYLDLLSKYADLGDSWVSPRNPPWFQGTTENFREVHKPARPRLEAALGPENAKKAAAWLDWLFNNA